MFAEDANNTLWTSGGGRDVVGWLNTKTFDETGDEQKSQGWTALILDTNGNGKRDDVRRARTSRSIRPRTSGERGASTTWPRARTARSGARSLGFPGAVVRLVAGAEPAGHGARRKLYEPPFNDANDAGERASRRAASTWTGTASFWAALASGQHGQLRSPQMQGSAQRAQATGQQCPEGWTLYTDAAARK